MERKKILIVDDEMDVLRVLETRLAKEGFEPILADTGTLAFSLAKERQPEVIVLDIKMPKMSGGEIANKLMADPMTKDIPVIFFSSLISDEKTSQIKQNHAGHIVLAKSTSVAELISTINKVISNSCSTP